MFRALCMDRGNPRAPTVCASWIGGTGSKMCCRQWRGMHYIIHVRSGIEIRALPKLVALDASAEG